MAEADLDAVLRIQAESYTEIVPESAQSLLAKLRAAPASCFVAQSDAGVVGYLIAVPVAFPTLPALDAPECMLPARPDALYLHDLALSPAARGTRTGGLLVERVLEHARGKQWPLACLVAIQQSAAYWEGWGFRPVPAPGPEVARKLASYGGGAQLMVRGLGDGATRAV